MIAGVLVLHHLAATAQFVVYTMEKTTTDLAFQLQLVRAIIVINNSNSNLYLLSPG